MASTTTHFRQYTHDTGIDGPLVINQISMEPTADMCQMSENRKVVPWRRKVSLAQKAYNQVYRIQHRKKTRPTLGELRDVTGVLTYGRKRGLSSAAIERIVAMVQGTSWCIDWRDHRRVPRRDRVPRSLEDDALRTPPRFWEITSPIPEHDTCLE
jgi:hypothetical protein